MKLNEMISSLESRGYTVKINHERASRVAVEEALDERRRGHLSVRPVTEPIYLLRQSGEEIDPRGGKTVVQILRDGVTIAVGKATCSPEDQFRKYEGSIKALGRAIADLSE